jgi:hypothetical protein
VPSPFTPNTTGISKGIVTFVQNNVTFTLVGQSAPQGYALAQAGAIKDVTDTLPFLTVEAVSGTSAPFSSGGGGNGIGWRIDEQPVFKLTSGVDYSVATIAEENILFIRDALTLLLNSYYVLGGPQNPAGIPNVYEARMVPNSERYLYLHMGHGVIYRVHEVQLRVKQQYNIANLAR